MRRHPRVSLIAALAENRCIGVRNRLPWHLPADLAHFKRLTLHKPIIMGRRTWESLPGLLPHRTHIVISRDPDFRAPGAILSPSPAAAIAAAGDVDEVMVVGGAEVFRRLLPSAQRMYLTLVHAQIPGDAFFPPWEPEAWREIERERRPADSRNAYDLSFLTLERLSGA
jgi:dihydrofolate reductase